MKKIKELVKDFLYGLPILSIIVLLFWLSTKYPIIIAVITFVILAILIGKVNRGIHN